MPDNAPGFVPTTLCDLCDNACGHCNWSRAGVQQPVDGWTAIRRDLAGINSIIVSYVVLSCPEFAADEKGEKYMHLATPEQLRKRLDMKPGRPQK